MTLQAGIGRRLRANRRGKRHVKRPRDRKVLRVLEDERPICPHGWRAVTGAGADAATPGRGFGSFFQGRWETLEGCEQA